MVIGVSSSGDETRLLGPVHEPDRTVVAQQQVVGHLAHGRPAPVGVSMDGEEQLVLGRGEPGFLGLLVAPAQEAPKARP